MWDTQRRCGEEKVWGTDVEVWWDMHLGPLGTFRDFGGTCEGCEAHAWHTGTLMKVQRDMWRQRGWSTLGMLVKGDTHEVVVRHMGARLDMWKSTAGQPWEDSRIHAGVH